MFGVNQEEQDEIKLSRTRRPIVNGVESSTVTKVYPNKDRSGTHTVNLITDRVVTVDVTVNNFEFHLKWDGSQSSI